MKVTPLPLTRTKKVERLKRSTTIKLVSIDGYTYTVYGSTGKVYTIKIGNLAFLCNCIDCQRNNNYCKHIYFIFLNVFGFIPDIERVYTMDELRGFHDAFLNKKTEGPKARNEQEDCIICFECNSTSDCFVCRTCENGFHSSCIKTMLQFSDKCPLCRSSVYDKSNLNKVLENM
jgi:DNA-binding Xre family transcriptional regulator